MCLADHFDCVMKILVDEGVILIFEQVFLVINLSCDGARTHGLFNTGVTVPPTFGKAECKNKKVTVQNRGAEGGNRMCARGQQFFETTKAVRFNSGSKGVEIPSVFLPK